MASHAGRDGLTLLALVALLLSSSALSGCKNTCEKALDHVMGCMTDFCGESPDNPACRRMAERDAEAPECTSEAEAQAEQMLAQDCDALTSAFRQYVSAAQTVEAGINLQAITRGATSYYESEHVSAAGQFLPFQFPASVGLTPATIPCGERAAPNPADWEQPTWQDLYFSLRDPHYFSYQFDSAGEGADATFTASAFGDLDCDGQLSTFVREGRVVNDEVQVDDLHTMHEQE